MEGLINFNILPDLRVESLERKKSGFHDVWRREPFLRKNDDNVSKAARILQQLSKALSLEARTCSNS